MNDLSKGIWNRTHDKDEISDLSFRTQLSFWIIAGLAISAISAYFTWNWSPINIWVFLFVGLVVPFAGILISTRSYDWRLSAIGYLLVVVGLGAILGPAASQFKTTVILNALFATFGITLVMSFIGITIKKDLAHWGYYLFFGLCALLLVRVVQIFFPTTYPNDGWWWKLIDYAAAVLFSLYILYDWNQAMRVSKTTDNAVDCAVGIYLDIINLFISLLRIFGRSSK